MSPLESEQIQIHEEDNRCTARTSKCCQQQLRPWQIAFLLVSIFVIFGFLIVYARSIVAGPPGGKDAVIFTLGPKPPRGFRFGGPLWAGAGTWAEKEKLPTPLSDLSATILGGYVYICGGINVNTQTSNNKCLQYDAIVETFNASTAAPEPRFRHAAIGYQNRYVYLFGGKNDLVADTTTRNVHRLDTTTWVWDTPTVMPESRSDITATLVGDKVYIMGGYDDNYDTPASVLVYDLVQNTWATLPSHADLVYPRGDAAAVHFEGKIYFTGGWGYDTAYVPLKRVDVFDVATHTWTQGPDMSVGRGDHSIVAVAEGRVLVVMGGETTSPVPNVNEVAMHFAEELAVDIGMWSARAPVPRARFRHASVVAPVPSGNSLQILIFGGQGPAKRTRDEVQSFFRTPHPNMYFHFDDRHH